MILSDIKLKELIASGELGVSPLSEKAIQPASIDCHLGDDFLVMDDSRMATIRLDEAIQYRPLQGRNVILPPKSFLLATTQESIRLPNNLTAFVEGRSSIGRMGLFIQNAGWVDPGFEGQITLELFNANSLPIELRAGWRICQLVFCMMDQHAANPYRGKYQGQRNTTGSRSYRDLD